MQHLANLLQALFSRSFFSVRCLGLIHKLLKITYPDQSFDLVLESHTHVFGMSYVSVKAQFLLMSLKTLSPFMGSGGL